MMHKFSAGSVNFFSWECLFMVVIPLNRLIPGMVLAKDVADMSGRMLLGRTAPITARHIKIFKAWGVTEVHVLAAEALLSDPLPLHPTSPNIEFSGQAQEMAEQLFGNNSHPLNQLMVTCATRAIYRRLERGVSVHVC